MRRLTLLLAILVIPLIHISANAAIIHVPAGYDLIQDAINVSRNGDTVLVEQGRYVGGISFNGHSIVLASNFLLTQDTTDINATIISGDVYTDTVVKINENELGNTMLYGFSIDFGRIGILIYNAFPQIMYNHISRFINTEYANGAAIICLGGEVTIVGNEIRRNSAGYGAGIWVEHNSGVIHHNILANNTSGLSSAIVLNHTGMFSVYNNTLYHNFAFTGQTDYGSLVVDSTNSSCAVYNNIFAFNDRGLGQIGGATPTNTYNDYFSNSQGNFYNCSQGNGEILLNPEFAGGNPFDLTLHDTSPCVNTGKPTSPYDPDGSRADMGAVWPPYPVPRGLLGGTVVNGTGLPIPNVRVYGIDFAGCDTTDLDGHFSFGMQPNDSTFSLLFMHHDYIDTTIGNYRVSDGDSIGMQIALISGTPRGTLTGHITDSVNGMPVGNVAVQIGNSGNIYYSDMSGNYFINKLTPGIYDLYFFRQSYDTLFVQNFEIVSEDTLTLNPQLAVSNYGYFLTYGNKDATPTPAVIGAELEIPAWGKAQASNPVDSVTYMHNPLSSNDSVIIADLGAYLPDFYVGRWDEIDTLPPILDPRHQGYTSHSLAAFAWIMDPPDPENYFVTGNDTVLISVYKLMVANNSALLGDTLAPFCEGYHPAYGPLMWGMNDGVTAILPLTTYPSLYFIEPAQVGYLNVITNDSALVPLAHVYASVNNSYKCGFTNDSGNHSFGWLLPGTYSVNFHKDRYWDTTLTDIIVSAGETTDVVVSMATYPPYGNIFGHITDNTNMPVIGAIVNVNGVGIADTTDENGYYSFDSLATGFHDLHVSHVRHTDTTFIDAAVPYYDSSEVNVIIRVLPPTTINVPDDFGSVNTAVDMSVYGDTILISPGIYHENIRRFNKELQLIGRGGRDSTTIQANLSGVPIMAMSGNLQESCLDGITFTASVNAPAITISGTGCTIRNCAFIGNQSGRGGAINAGGGEQLYLFGNNFTDNISSGGGGAIGATDITIWAVDNIFKNNNAAGEGGAISYWDAVNFNFERNLFIGNSSHGFGSVIYFDRCRYGDLYNNTMAFNDSHSQNGCCIYILLSYFITVANNIISQNAGGGIRTEANWQAPLFVYNDVWDNTPDYYNATPGSGSISEDPLFEGGDPFSYHLTASSPCIDSGDPGGMPDPDGTRVDMGAFYFYHEFNQCPYILGDINASGTPNGIDVTYGVRYFKGGPVPPNTCDNCPEAPPFYAAGDVNGSCTFNGIDISYMVNYFKGGSALHPCPDCPPIAGGRRTSVGVREEAIPENLKTQKGLLNR